MNNRTILAYKKTKCAEYYGIYCIKFNFK